MTTTYVDSDDIERCDDCGEIIEDCTCACGDCGDSVHECSCDEE